MASDLKDKIVKSIENLVTLEIVTAVGHVRFDDEDGKEGTNLPDLDYSKDHKVILTKIDLLQGDIKTIYDEEFVNGEYENLKAYHAAREKEGYGIIEKNVAALEKLLNLVKNNLQE
ncbi:hypothetical protein QUF76_07285 [Desulfobacterales bacterium HSG16]|nr:hypothetical protein [Desulfobacterales bacterium HSG16]